MKIKNVVVGGYIQSKKDSKQLIAGHCYQVADKDTSDKTVRLTSIDDSFDDSLWFCVSDFRKQRPQPQLKQLDQSVFNGLDEKWRFAAVDRDGSARAYNYNQVPIGGNHEPHPDQSEKGFEVYEFIGTGYDASNWQNSLIERDDIAKELLEVDLSSELTGSELCRAMLARGDVCVPCFIAWDSDAEAIAGKSIWLVHEFLPEAPNFHAGLEDFYCAVPINTRTGEPLTASEVGL